MDFRELHNKFNGQGPGDVRNAQKASLRHILEAELQENARDLRFVFTYGAEDEWQHEIEILGTGPPNEPLPPMIDTSTQEFCYGGQGARLAEDCNQAVGRDGPRSWQRLKEAFDDNVDDKPESVALREWCMPTCANYAGSDQFDPYEFKEHFVNIHLKRIKKRAVS